MNREIQQQFQTTRREVEIEWEATRVEWRDGTTDDFTHAFWGPLVDEFDDYQRPLEELMLTLERAQRLLNHR